MKIANAQLWVRDQDEALAFWTEKIGMEVKADVTVAELGNFRWLTVGPADQDEFALVLMAIPGPPVFDAKLADDIRSVMERGGSGGIFLTTDDCRATFEALKAQGVEFTQEPMEQPYGIDCGFRDPSGNHIRLTQLTS